MSSSRFSKDYKITISDIIELVKTNLRRMTDDEVGELASILSYEDIDRYHQNEQARLERDDYLGDIDE